MKLNSSIAKIAASTFAGGVLAASLYANAVYVPQQHQTLEENLQSELAAIVAGDAELAPVADGFQVREIEVTKAAVEAVAAAEVAEVAETAAVEVQGEQEEVSVVATSLSAYDSLTAVVAGPVKEPGTGNQRPLGTPGSFGVGSLGSILASPQVPVEPGSTDLPSVVEAVVSTGQGGGVGGSTTGSASGNNGVTGNTGNSGGAAGASTSNSGGTVGSDANSSGGGDSNASPTSPNA